MKKLLLILFILPFMAQSQTSIDEKDGILFTYTINKLKEDAKFTYYSASVKVVNSNDFELFYQGSKNKVNPFFATIEESNSGESYYFEGVPSRLQLGDIPLYYLKPKSSFSTTKEFKVKKDVTPTFKLAYSNNFDRLNDLK